MTKKTITQLFKLLKQFFMIYVSFGWGDREFYINTPEWKDLP